MHLPTTASNRLLDALPIRVRQRLVGQCLPVVLHLDEVLAQPGQPITRVYFPTAGFISLVATTDTGSSLDIGLIGSEGMLGMSVLLGVKRAPLFARVMGSGQALCLEASCLLQQLEETPPLQRLLKAYLHVVMRQLALRAACIHYHRVEARLACCLLMIADRAQTNSFHLTHQVLARMLGVRRVGITTAAGNLQEQRLIHYNRGDIEILDRSGLQAISCDCYAGDQAIYASMAGAASRTGIR